MDIPLFLRKGLEAISLETQSYWNNWIVITVFTVNQEILDDGLIV